MSLLNQIKPKQPTASLKTPPREYALKEKRKLEKMAAEKFPQEVRVSNTKDDYQWVEFSNPISAGFMLGIGFQISLFFVSIIVAPLLFCAFFVLGVLGAM